MCDIPHVSSDHWPCELRPIHFVVNRDNHRPIGQYTKRVKYFTINDERGITAGGKTSRRVPASADTMPGGKGGCEVAPFSFRVAGNS